MSEKKACISEKVIIRDNNTTIISMENGCDVILKFSEEDNLEVEDKIIGSLLSSYEKRLKIWFYSLIPVLCNFSCEK